MLHAPWNNRIRNFSGFFKDAWGLFAARCLLFSTTRPEQFSKQSGRAEKKRDASLSVCMFILDTLCDCKRDIDVYINTFKKSEMIYTANHLPQPQPQTV